MSKSEAKNLNTGKISFKKLIPKRRGFRPEDCSAIFGTGRCATKNYKGSCPTKCLETCECGGWSLDIKKGDSIATLKAKILSKQFPI